MPLKYENIVKKLRKINALGWIKTHRSGNTGIGKTLEDLLGIKENNVPGPDAEMLELKSARRESKSMVTLFTKSPLPSSANSVLLERFGYPHPNNEGKILQTTVGAIAYNTLKGKPSFKIRIRDKRVELISEAGEVLGYWDNKTLQNSFKKKLPRLMYVKADARGSGEREEFHFNEAWLLSGFDFENFLNLLVKGIIMVDIRIGQNPNGSTHDHGTGFRVFPDKLNLCFSKRERIM
jgi:hypothetical protein